MNRPKTSPNWQSTWLDAAQRCVVALGYEFVDAERTAGGLLRVTIDRLPGTPGGDSVLVEDCEKVTRQLQHVLEVEGCDYARLEVSSPGLDRPLKKPADYARFAGLQIDLTLKLAFQGRKRWRGELQPNGEGWRLIFDDGKGDQALDFALGEVREARLVPVLDFKGRRFAPAGLPEQQPAQGDMVDGGREQ